MDMYTSKTMKENTMAGKNTTISGAIRSEEYDSIFSIITYPGIEMTISEFVHFSVKFMLELGVDGVYQLRKNGMHDGVEKLRRFLL